MNVKKGLLTFLFTSILSVSAIAAEAGTAATANVTDYGVRLRAENNTDSTILKVLSKNTVLQVHETVGDWFRVTVDNQTGYVMGTFVAFPESEPAIEPEPAAVPEPVITYVTGTVNADNVRLRAKNNTNSAIVATMRNQSQLLILEQNIDGWHRVSFGELEGFVMATFVHSPYVVAVPARPTLPEPTTLVAAEPENDVIIGVLNTNNVRLRAANNTDSAILATMRNQTQLTVLDHSIDGWHRVRYGAATGYVLGTFVTFPPELQFSNDTGMINANNVRLRAGKGTDTEILETMRRRTTLTVLGRYNDWYNVRLGELTGYVYSQFLAVGAEAISAIPTFNVELVDWWTEGRHIMRPGTRATVTDVATGMSFQIRVMSSGNHADVEPLTAADTAIIRQIRGGFSWTPRAVLVTVGGRTIAASANGMPHGGGSISGNNFAGHFCIHFLNSRNHFNNAIDRNHQRQVQVAANSR